MLDSSSANDELFYKSLIESYVDKTHNPRFVERHWLRKQVEAKLALPSCRFLLLTAEPGAGKSAFTAWLAHLNSNWCRYFIRRDQRTPLGDPGAHSFLLQTGFQLAAIYPDAFNQEQVKITVAQRIGQAENSEIVGAEIGKLFASPFYQKVVQIQQEVNQSGNSTVAGIRIDEWYADSRSVPLTNLQFMALFDPAFTLLKQNKQQQIVVLVDALDELRYRDPELSLLKWLADCPELPANLRFVLTSRPDDGLLNHFRGAQQPYLQELIIEEEDPEVTKDLTQYAYQLVATEPKVQETLAQLERDTATFARQAVEKANGNFGYLSAIGRAVDQAIHQEQLDLLKELLNLSQLPETLQELYLFFLTKIKERVAKEKVAVEDDEGDVGFLPAWAAVYKPILSVLSVALEPLTLTQIQQLGPIQAEYDYLVGAIENLRQFLDQISNSYRLYHSTLPEFLTSPKTKENSESSFCYVDVVKQNQRIVNFYQAGKQSWAEVDLTQIVKDDYGQRHLAQHLVKADRTEEFHILLSLEKDGKNVWFKAKDDEGHTDSFLADLELAWAQADEMYNREPGKSIGLQCRYALIRASINTLAEIPTELRIALVKHRYWKPAKALAYVRQIPDLKFRFDSLMALETQLAETEPLRHQVLQAALQVVRLYEREVPDWESQTWHGEDLATFLPRAEALMELVDKLTPELLPQALEIAQTIQSASARAQALTALADKLPEALSQAIETTQAIEDEFDYVRALTALAGKLTPDLLSQALEMIEATQSEYRRTEALMALTDKLTPDLLPKSIEVAQAIQNECDRTNALTALANRLTPDLLCKALEAAQTIQSQHYRAQVLTALADKLPEAKPKALELTQAIQQNYNRAAALTALSDKLTPELLPQALEAAQAIQKEFDRARVLTELADKLAPELLPKALEIAQEIQNDDLRALALTALALTALADKLIPEALPQALEAAQTIQEEYYYAWVLTALADKLPDLLPRALEVTQAIQDESNRVLVLNELIDKLTPDLLPEALKAAQAIQQKEFRALALIKLTDKVPEALPQALAATQAIQDEHWRAETLTALVDKLTPDLLPEALEAAQAIQQEEFRALALIALVNKLTPELLTQVLEAAQAFQIEIHRAQVLSALAYDLTPELLPQALEIARAIQEEGCRTLALTALALTALANKLMPELLPQALEAARTIQEEYYRAQALSALVDKLPEVLPEALEAAGAIQEEYYRARALAALADKLTPELLPQALEAAQTIQNECYRTDALIAIADKLTPDLLPKALEAAQAIRIIGFRVQALTALADKLPEALPDALETALAIQEESNRGLTRMEANQLFREKIDRAQALVVQVDKPEALPEALETAQAIEDEFDRAQALTALAGKMTLELLPKALEAVKTFQFREEGYQAQILMALASKLPEALPRILEAAQAIQSVSTRTEVLRALALPLANAPNCFELWKNVLHFLSHRTRPDMLRNLTALTPVIANFGEEAMAETVQAIEDVSRWWP